MSVYAVYDTSSGEILRMMDVDPADISLQVGAGENYLSATSETDVTHYVSLGPDTLTAKTAQSITWDTLSITSNGTDTATATGIINPSTATIKYYTDDVEDSSDDISEVSITDGTLSITSIVVGTSEIYIDAGLIYLEYQQDITVT